MLDGAPDKLLDILLLRPGAAIPERTRPGDAAFDLRTDESFALRPGERHRAGTGVALVIADGAAGLITPRSGLAEKHGLMLLNSPGLIDPNYRGEIGVVLHNAGSEAYEVRAGDRIAQLLIVNVLSPEVREVDELPPASDPLRGSNGFGSSGR